MPPLVVRVSRHKTVLGPDTHARQVKPGFDESPAEDVAHSISMENVDCTARLHAGGETLKRGKEELVELLILDAVIFDGQAGHAFEGNSIGRIGQNEVCPFAIHQPIHIFLHSSISAQ